MRSQFTLLIIFFLIQSLERATSQTSCTYYCPSGWVTVPLSGSNHCYLFPPIPIPLKSFWDMQNYCKSLQPTSYVITLNSLAENAGAGLRALTYFAQYIAALGSFFIWIGAYYLNGAWHWVDGSPWSYNVMIFNPFFPLRDGYCAYIDPKSTFVTWSYRWCTDTNGATACEMAPLQQCGVTTPTTTTEPPYAPPTCAKNIWADYTKSRSAGYLAVGGTSQLMWLTDRTLQSCSVACTYYSGCLSFDFDAVTGDCRLLQASSQITCTFVDDPPGEWQHYDLAVKSAY